MTKISLQFFGGRGDRMGGGGDINVNIRDTTSLVSAREDKQQLVDEVLGVFRDVNEQYGYIINDILLADLGPNSPAIAYYDSNRNIGVNQKFFSDKIIDAYDRCVKNGFHPSNGNRTALEAVTAHELGHALTDAAAARAGLPGLDAAAGRIVEEARKQINAASGKITHRGVVQMAKAISGYATHSNAEAVAEAYADVYCNAGKAKAESRAIVDVLNRYLA